MLTKHTNGTTESLVYYDGSIEYVYYVPNEVRIHVIKYDRDDYEAYYEPKGMFFYGAMSSKLLQGRFYEDTEIDITQFMDMSEEAYFQQSLIYPYIDHLCYVGEKVKGL